MYRSKRADRKYLEGWLKIAAVFVMLFIIGGVVVLGQGLMSADEAEDGHVAAFLPGAETAAVLSFAEIVSTYERSGGTEIVILNESAEDEYSEGIEPDDEFDEFELPVFSPERNPSREPGSAPRIALTFDDGPGRFTVELLDILDEHGGRVTFCVIGDLVENNAKTVIRAFESGHEIIGHSWDHSNLSRRSTEDITAQILQTSAIIDAVLGEPPPPLFRVPFGVYNRRIAEASADLGYAILNWGIDPRDWQFRDEDHIFDYIMENARDGAIVVLHDVHQTTIDAMARVIPALLEEGYELVTASEILEYVYGEIVPGYEFTGTRK